MLIQIAILALCFGVIVWIISVIPIPEPYGRIVQVVCAVVFLIFLLRMLLPLAGVRL
jgi:hypothetical protein